MTPIVKAMFTDFGFDSASLAVQEKLLGKDSDETVQTALKVAAIQSHQSEYYIKALEMYKQALDAKIVEVPAITSAQPDYKTTYDIAPHAGEAGFDDSSWPLIKAEDLATRRSGGHVGTFRLAAQRLFQACLIVAIEDVAEQALVEIRRSHGPVCDREGQVHVDLHHQPRVVVCRMVAPQRVDEGTMADEPVFLDVAAEVHELVDQVHACRRAHEQPADVGREDIAENDAARDRHEDEDDEELGPAAGGRGRVLADLRDRERVVALKGVALLAALSDAELWELVKAGQWRRIAGGKAIIRENDPGQSFFFLGAGQVKVTRQGRLLNVIDKRECFGEMAYIRGGELPRHATVESMTDVLVSEFAPEALAQISLGAQLQLTRALVRNLVDLLPDFWHCNVRLWQDKLGQISLATTTLFWGVSGNLRYIVLAWSAAALGYTTTQASSLVGVVAIGTAVGAVIASMRMRLEQATKVMPMGIGMGLLVIGMNFIDNVWVAAPFLVLLGGLGGFLVVPAIMMGSGMATIHAVGSSLVSVGAFGLTTAVSYAFAGLVDWRVAIIWTYR